MRGLTYIGLLIFLALMALSTAAALHIGVIMHRRYAEQELLEIGQEFRHALLSYAISTPLGAERRPTSLQDLLKDPRYPQTKRHLRKIYTDPITGKDEWGIMQSPAGSGIIGVFSLSTQQPIKIGNFDQEFIQFSGKTSYRDWVFSLAQ